jgi:hypothetical protein
MLAISRVAAGPRVGPARKIATGLALAALLATLGACAAGTATSGLATPATASTAAAVPNQPASPTAAPAPAQPAPSATAAAPAAPPQHLTKTEINEKCWMRTEKFKADKLDKRMKLVDQCVDEMTRAQGGA